MIVIDIVLRNLHLKMIGVDFNLRSSNSYSRLVRESISLRQRCANVSCFSTVLVRDSIVKDNVDVATAATVPETGAGRGRDGPCIAGVGIYATVRGATVDRANETNDEICVGEGEYDI